jgi:hypothetical protein
MMAVTTKRPEPQDDAGVVEAIEFVSDGGWSSKLTFTKATGIPARGIEIASSGKFGPHDCCMHIETARQFAHALLELIGDE